MATWWWPVSGHASPLRYAPPMEVVTSVMDVLVHPCVTSVDLVGSRADGRATERSDYDFVVHTTNFDRVAEALPGMVASLGPLSRQWDRLSDTMCFMLILPGPVKIDLIFRDAPHEHDPPWEPAPETLDGIDAHFWDWMLWLSSKLAKGETGLVQFELERLHRHLLRPLGERQAPSSIVEAVAHYQRLRDDVERRFGCTVSRTLEAAVLPAVQVR
jgi:hypothetical protein